MLKFQKVVLTGVLHVYLYFKHVCLCCIGLFKMFSRCCFFANDKLIITFRVLKF